MTRLISSVALLLVGLGVGACDSEPSRSYLSSTTTTLDASTSTMASTNTTSTTSTTVEAAVFTREEVCRKWLDVIGDLTMDDDRTAVALRALALLTDDEQLATELRKEADQFAAHDEQISSVPVATICGF